MGQRKKSALELLVILLSPIILVCMVCILAGAVVSGVYGFGATKFRKSIDLNDLDLGQGFKQFGILIGFLFAIIFAIGLVFPIVLIVFGISFLYLFLKFILDLI